MKKAKMTLMVYVSIGIFIAFLIISCIGCSLPFRFQGNGRYLRNRCVRSRSSERYASYERGVRSRKNYIRKCV